MRKDSETRIAALQRLLRNYSRQTDKRIITFMWEEGRTQAYINTILGFVKAFIRRCKKRKLLEGELLIEDCFRSLNVHPCSGRRYIQLLCRIPDHQGGYEFRVQDDTLIMSHFTLSEAHRNALAVQYRHERDLDSARKRRKRINADFDNESAENQEVRREIASSLAESGFSRDSVPQRKKIEKPKRVYSDPWPLPFVARERAAGWKKTNPGFVPQRLTEWGFSYANVAGEGFTEAEMNQAVESVLMGRKPLRNKAAVAVAYIRRQRAGRLGIPF